MVRTCFASPPAAPRGCKVLYVYKYLVEFVELMFNSNFEVPECHRTDHKKLYEYGGELKEGQKFDLTLSVGSAPLL